MPGSAVYIVLLGGILACSLAADDAGDDIGKRNGEACPLPNGVEGVCQRINNCPAAKEALERDDPLVICSYEELTPIVCCATASVAERMCAQYGEEVFRYERIPTIVQQTVKIDQCFRKSSLLKRRRRVAGGEKAVMNEFPHMATLGFGKSLQEPSPWICGGVLISNRFVLTVAHCIQNHLGGPKFVRLGDLILSSTYDGNQHRDYPVSQTIIHPEYQKHKFNHNIGLLRLSVDVTFSASIRPACLHTQPKFTGDAIVTGWGGTETGITSDHLMKLKVSTRDTEVCSKAYESLATSPSSPRVVEEFMICAASDEPKKDTCAGDSGGPLQVELTTPYCMYSIAGLTSFGKRECGGSADVPSVYTRVSYYVPWIESIVWPK